MIDVTRSANDAHALYSEPHGKSLICHNIRKLETCATKIDNTHALCSARFYFGSDTRLARFLDLAFRFLSRHQIANNFINLG